MLPLIKVHDFFQRSNSGIWCSPGAISLIFSRSQEILVSLEARFLKEYPVTLKHITGQNITSTEAFTDVRAVIGVFLHLTPEVFSVIQFYSVRTTVL